MQILHHSQGQLQTASCIDVTPKGMRSATSPLAWKIISLLSKRPEGIHAAAIAKYLKEPDQKIYYHLRNLQKAGMLEVDHIEETRGGIGKSLRLTASAACMRWGALTPITTITATDEEKEAFLAPFIQDGKWNARIVIGSPEPHGQEGARSRDASIAVDLAMFLGSFLSTTPQEVTILDTELRDWQQNLIIIGGPVVNKAAQRINHHSPFPYDIEKRFFKSKKTQRKFSDDTIGIIAKIPNPLSKGKWILLIQGKRYNGTRSAVIAFFKNMEEICASSRGRSAEVGIIVNGVDADNDGVPDSVKILEK